MCDIYFTPKSKRKKYMYIFSHLVSLFADLFLLLILLWNITCSWHALWDSPNETFTIWQSLQDFAILRSLNLSQTPQFSQELANFPQILGLDASRDVIETLIQSKKGCFSVWKIEWTALRSHHGRFTRATLDKQTESGTNPRYLFGFICSGWSRGLLSITRHRYTQRWEILWRK